MQSELKKRLQQVRKVDINFYQKYLGDLYSQINKRRDFEDLYSYLDRTSGYLGKAIVKKNQDDKKFILPISWLFSLSTKLEINLQDSFIKKYPTLCPYCLETECVCLKTDKRPLRDIPVFKMREIMDSQYETIINTVDTYNLDRAVKNIVGIFNVNETIWRFAGPWHHIAKIHEEIAEIQEAYVGFVKKEKLLDNVAEEIADVFAWILGAWAITYPGQSLDDGFIDYYHSKDCPLCGKFPCDCKPFDSRFDSLIDMKQIDNVKEELKLLAELLPMQYGLSELIKSYDLVANTKNEPAAKESLAQTRDFLREIENNIHPSDRNRTKVLVIVDRIKRNIDAILRLDPSKSVKLGVDNPQNSKSKKFDVFLSYSTIDKDEARKIESFLSRRKYKVFLSEKTINPSEEWKEEIREALENSKLLCILATPNSLKSEWVIREHGAAWGLRIRTLPVLFQCATKDLPDILRDHQAINFHEISKIVDVIKKISKV